MNGPVEMTGDEFVHVLFRSTCLNVLATALALRGGWEAIADQDKVAERSFAIYQRCKGNRPDGAEMTNADARLVAAAHFREALAILEGEAK